MPPPLLTAEQVLRDARGREDVVARGLELLTQPVQIDVEQMPLPLAHLAGDDHGLDVGAIHQRHHSAGHLVQRRHVEFGGVEDDDVGLLAGRQRAGLAIEPQRLGRVVSGAGKPAGGVGHGLPAAPGGSPQSTGFGGRP